MEKLFGMPIVGLMIGLIFIFGVGAIVMTCSVLRNRVMFKIAVRNLPRRPVQTSLIVLGLMLAAMLFSASFAMGDTITHSIRTLATEGLGEVDILVQSELLEAGDRPTDFNENQLQEVSRILENVSEVEGIAPAILENVPVVAPEVGLNEPAVYLLALDQESLGSFDTLVDEQGKELLLNSLGTGEIFISTELAKELESNIGDEIEVTMGTEVMPFIITGIYEKGGNPAGELSMTLPLSEVQTLMGREGLINALLITHQGDALEGAAFSGEVMDILEPSLEDTGLEAQAVKQNALDEAESVGNIFSSMFLMLGQFSIAAGILLIFLIFIMLAAERKHELGIARAIGTQRSHVIRLFTYEGVGYALLASAVGSVLGLLVGRGMVHIMAVAFGQVDFDIVYYFNPRSPIIAYLMGVLLTVLVVAISAWRVSSLNIVRAIRDIPEPPKTGKGSLKGLIATILLPLVGLMMLSSGIQQAHATPYLMGGSLIIIGVALLAKRFRLPDRAAYTLAGIGLLVWWISPDHPFVGEMEQTMDLFFLSGMMVVAGAVWVVMYNSDLLLSLITFVFGRFPSMAPVIKTAVAYPMANRFRTGMALAMFALIVFTLVVMSISNNSFRVMYDDTDRLTGGYDLRAQVNYNNPVTDIEATLDESDGVGTESFDSIAGMNGALLGIWQVGTEVEADTAEEDNYTDMYIQGIDSAYAQRILYEFDMMAAGYDSSEQIWQALISEPGTAVVSSWMVPSRVNYNMGDTPEFQIEGFVKEDEVLPELYLEARHPVTEATQNLRIIGVLEGTAMYGAMITTSQTTLNTLLPTPRLPLVYFFEVDPGREDVSELAKNLESGFQDHGMEVTVLSEDIADQSKVMNMFMDILQGFMGLGLVVGIAALGVISARSVVERRQQIGVLRALGFQQGMVQRAFLIESSFVALLGIALGVALGCAIGMQVVNDAAQSTVGLQIHIPWARILFIVTVAYVASLITTYLPARQASRVYPADALRYE